MSENKQDEALDLDSIDFSIDFEQVEQVSRVFFEESKEILEELDSIILRFEESPSDLDQINLLFRKVHTIKGSVGAVPGGQLLGSLSHEFEALLTRIKRENGVVDMNCVKLFLKSSRMMKVLAKALRDKRELYPEELSEAIELITDYGNFQLSETNSSVTARGSNTSAALRTIENDEEAGIWLSKNQLNEFLKISGELLVLKNFFQMMSQTVNFREQPDLYQRRQTDFSQNLSKICDQFQHQVQSVRKEEAKDIFQGLNVVIRQASMELNKTVQFEMHGGDIFLDKGLGKDLYDALVHVARNSVDHGIEDAFERTLLGKLPTGSLSLDISEKNNTIFLKFKDDGNGLDKEKILQRALKNGLVAKEDIPKLNEDDIFRFIFQPGFSTKEKVTTISGRGVGMDIVLTTVEKYKGKVFVESTMGQGMTIRFEIPVPQNIMVESSLICGWQDIQFAVPLSSVLHIGLCDELQVTEVNGLRFCQFNGQTVPLLNYQEILQFHTLNTLEDVRMSSVVFIRSHEFIVALLVDRIESQTDIVVKALGPVIGEQKGFKGVSILADEKVTFVFDPEMLREMLMPVEIKEAA